VPRPAHLLVGRQGSSPFALRRRSRITCASPSA
jgi:hypothetical protein